jgi:hypothetical protein
MEDEEWRLGPERACRGSSFRSIVWITLMWIC